MNQIYLVQENCPIVSEYLTLYHNTKLIFSYTFYCPKQLLLKHFRYFFLYVLKLGFSLLTIAGVMTCLDFYFWRLFFSGSFMLLLFIMLLIGVFTNTNHSSKNSSNYLYPVCSKFVILFSISASNSTEVLLIGKNESTLKGLAEK